MAKTINTRIQLKYDSLASWQTNNPTLLAGEIACVSIGEITTDNKGNRVIPPVMMKVGPGAFNDLGWTAAKAADVYTWAKKETPDWTDFPALPIEIVDNGTGKFITDITYTGNKITITRDDAVNSIAAEDASLYFDKPKGDVKAKVKISEAEGNILTLGADGLYVPSPEEVSFPGADNEGNGEYIEGTVAVVSNGTFWYNTGSGKYTLSEDYVNVPTKEYVDNIDTGVMSVSGKEAIKATGDADVEVSLALDPASGNVVLSQSNAGLKANIDLSAYRLIADDEDTKYGIEYDSANKVIKLTNEPSKTQIDATDFIKDGMISSVELKDNDLIITWNTDAGIDSTTIPLDYLIDVYTIEGVDGTTVKVTASTAGNKHSVAAEVKEGSLKNAHIAADAAIAKDKFAKGVQDSLGLADTAVQPEDLSGENANITVKTADTANKTKGTLTILANGENKFDGSTDISIDVVATSSYTADKEQLAEDLSNKKDKQDIVTAKGSATKLLTVSQNENGVVSLAEHDLSIKNVKEATNHATITEDKDYIIFSCGSSSVNV